MSLLWVVGGDSVDRLLKIGTEVFDFVGAGGDNLHTVRHRKQAVAGQPLVNTTPQIGVSKRHIAEDTVLSGFKVL